MTLQFIDWAIIITFLAMIIAVGLTFTQKAGKNIESFFLGGRNLPWWIAGTSMVATTFAADTPLAVTELVSKHGISGNWLWWNALSGGMLTTFFFAKLWHKAGILTEVELIELRYSGKKAAFLRGFKAIYMGVFMNAIIIGWVNLALLSLLQVFFDLSSEEGLIYVAVAMLLVVIYSGLSGLLGVAVTDMIQFVVAMIGCIILAVIVVNSDQIGGIIKLKATLPDWKLSFFPNIGERDNYTSILTLSFGSFFAFVGIQWWSSWYPGAEPGGGGYVAQRMMSAKNEKHAVYATLFFQIAHYCIRPWPWIVVALCATVLYPQLEGADVKLGYVMAMKDFLPVGLKGLLLVAFFAAYMSTISTQLNWGSSYLINDLYKRFIKPNAEEKQLVTASRISVLAMSIIGLIVTTQMTSVSAAWVFIIECGAGLGLVLILRWYWWRINAWSEITATIAPFIAFGFTKFYLAIYVDSSWGLAVTENPKRFFLIVGFTTITWIIATFISHPTSKDTLNRFYQRVKPEGFWKPVREDLNINKTRSTIADLFMKWISGITMAYSSLFLIGSILFLEWINASIFAILFIISTVFLSIKMKES